MLAKVPGPLLVGLGAMLWATDTLFRLPNVSRLDPVFIVFLEHLIALAVLAPFMFYKHGQSLLKLKLFEWVAAALIGAGGSALALIFFTASFRFVNPSVSILLQKLQPILVLILAFIFLKERPGRNFFGWALLAFIAAIVLSFPDLDFDFLDRGFDVRSRGVSYALAAAGLWAIATVAGKALLNRTTPGVATFWRFAFGLGALTGLLIFSGARAEWSVAWRPEVFQSLIYMSLVPGLLAMVIYYQGLNRSAASVATFMELLFPVAAVAINTYFLNEPLNPTQLVAGSTLLLAVTMISLQGRQG